MSNSTPQEPATHEPKVSQRRRTAPLAGLLLFVLVLAAFLPALSNGFVGYDDPEYVTENDHVRAGLTWEGVQWAFRSTEAANWHPVTRLSHMLDCQLYGLAPWGHHLTSILLHALNATLLLVVLRRMTGAMWRSFAVAMLFGLHPLRVESVAWIAERKDVLSTLFWLLTLWAYAAYVERSKVHSPQSTVGSPKTGVGASRPTIEAPRGTDHASRITHHAPRFYLLSLLFFALGLMSKPMVVTLPCVLLLLDYWPLSRFGLKTQDSRLKTCVPLFLEKLPFFLAAAAFSAVTFAVQKHGGAVAANLPFPDRFANAVVSYCRYLGKLFWPVDLAVFYPGVEHWPAVMVAAAALLLLAISVVAIILRLTHPYVLVGWLWFLGTLVPVIGLVQVGMQSMADRYSYIPSIGILLAAVWAAHAVAAGILPAVEGGILPPGPAPEPSSVTAIPRGKMPGSTAGRMPAVTIAAWGILATAALLCAALTLRQLSYWKNTEILFRHALRVTKDNYGAHHALGMALDRQGRLDEAISEYRATIRARSNYVLAYNNLAVDLNQKGRLEEAMQQLQTAFKLQPAYADPYNNMGMILEKQGRFDEALQMFQKAVSLNLNFPNAYYNLGISLSRKGLPEEAAKAFQRVIELRPNDAEAHNNLGVVLERQGKLAEATREYLRAAQLNPAYPSAHYNLGVALARQGHLPEAIDEFREALRLKPDYPSAQTNLALALSLLQGAQGKH